jgi:hypothetical protein
MSCLIGKSTISMGHFPWRIVSHSQRVSIDFHYLKIPMFIPHNAELHIPVGMVSTPQAAHLSIDFHNMRHAPCPAVLPCGHSLGHLRGGPLVLRRGLNRQSLSTPPVCPASML